MDIVETETFFRVLHKRSRGNGRLFYFGEFCLMTKSDSNDFAIGTN